MLNSQASVELAMVQGAGVSKHFTAMLTLYFAMS